MRFKLRLEKEYSVYQYMHLYKDMSTIFLRPHVISGWEIEVFMTFRNMWNKQ